MRRQPKLDRRFFLAGAAGSGALALGGCDRLTGTPWVERLLGTAETVNRRVQRLVSGRAALAPEYGEADLSPKFKANGTSDPEDPQYRSLARSGFAEWRLEVGGLVERPGRFSLAELRHLPARTQITRHDCVEGWSCIGGWTGAQLGPLLERVGRRAEARYVVFHSVDTLDASAERYYESVDLDDAFHPQTILAYEMNGQTLPVAHGAPLRLRVERQLGYKMAKYVMRIELVDSPASIGRGKGGYWEDRGYAWYAGI